jgi:MYXO-CTERM domain-containing protein
MMLMLAWILSSPTLAQEPVSNSSPCPALSESLDTLETAGLRHAYDCVAANDQAMPALLERIAAQPERETLTRALAVWRIHRLDEPITDEESRAYQGGDRRLLTDAVKAKKGRKSASPDNEKIFTELGWYAPVATYTDGLLDDNDRANIDLLRTPAPVPEPELVFEPEPLAEKVDDTKGCGCSSQPGAGSLWGLVGLVGLLAMRRRSGLSRRG